MEERERKLLLLLQAGIPLVKQPYLRLAQALGITEREVMALIERLLTEGKIRRLGAVPNHYALGISANGMAVWDVPDDRVGEIGRKMGAYEEVTHCYRRPRHFPRWPYNLFAMIHGHSREEVLKMVERIANELGLTDVPREVIFSTRILKKTGTRLREKGLAEVVPPGRG